MKKKEQVNVIAGDVLRDLRKGAGMSQMDLGAELGLTYQMVQKYEKGSSTLNLYWLMQYAQVFGKSAGDLVGAIEQRLKRAGVSVSAPRKPAKPAKASVKKPAPKKVKKRR